MTIKALHALNRDMTFKEFEIQRALGSLSYDIKRALIGKSRTSVEILIALSTDEDIFIRSHVARNHNTPTKVLIKLAKDKNWNVRYWVVSNPNTPEKVFEELSADVNINVRKWQEIRANSARRYILINDY